MKPIPVIICITVIAAVSLLTTTFLWMPEQVAQHFSGSGQATGLVARNSYAMIIVGILAGMTLVMVLSMTLVPRRFPGLVNIPNRTFWFTDPHRDQTIQSLERFCLSITVIVQMLIMAMHGLLIHANQSVPPRLDSIGFTIAISVFGLVMIVWIVALWKRFRVPSQT